MNRVNKTKKVIKITAIILVILIILGIVLTEGIGNYFVNYAIARSGAGGDRKVSEETKIEIQGEDEQIIEKSSDDGEPSGTAGGPMLNILKKNNLGNILVIVTRYFGGILLGTGGLVRAYSDATLEAINVAEKIAKCIGLEAEAELEYNNLESFKYYCKKSNIYIKDYDYSEKIICKIQLEECNKERLIEDFNTKKVNLIKLKFLSKKLIDKSIIN